MIGRIRLEPLALLLCIICICMSVLSLLSFTTSAADMRLAQRYGETVKTRYLLEEEGQRFLLEAESLDTTGIIEKEIEKEGYRLSIVLDKQDDRLTVRSWKIVKVWEQDNGIDGLWKGD